MQRTNARIIAVAAILLAMGLAASNLRHREAGGESIANGEPAVEESVGCSPFCLFAEDLQKNAGRPDFSTPGFIAGESQPAEGTVDPPAVAELPRRIAAVARPADGPVANDRAAMPAPGRQANRRPAAFQFQPGGGGRNLLVQADRETIRALGLAKDMIEKKKFLQAVELLQRVLDREKDGFYYPDSEKRDVQQSVRMASQRLIGGLPKEGRDVYELKFGARAAALLDEAMAKPGSGKPAGGTSAVNEVARRYFHTKAGYAAMYRMGITFLDRGQPLAAALCFERLRSVSHAAAQWEPQLSLQAAIAWRRAGLSEKSLQVLAEFQQVNGGAEITLGGKATRPFAKPEDGAAWMTANFGEPATTGGAETTAGNWPQLRGDATRSAAAVLPPAGGDVPDKDVRWRFTTITDPLDPTVDLAERGDTERLKVISDAIHSLRTANRQLKTAYLPQMQPVVVGDTLLVRTPGFLRAVDRKTGRRMWESVNDESLASLFQGDGEVPVASSVQQISQLLAQRLWNDLTWGAVASDGRLLFAVEETEIAVPTYDPVTRRRTTPRPANRLTAFDVATGRIRWTIGGVEDNDPALPDDSLAGTYFLGPPLPLGGRLYCLAEERSEVRLLAFDLTPSADAFGSPKLLWSQPLVGPNLNITQDWVRRTAGSTVSYADGVMVCSTDAGYVVGVDLTSRSLLWAYRYEENNGPPIQRPFPRPQPQPQQRGPGWQDSAAMIVDGNVVVTPPGSDEIVCLKLVDGSVVWKQKRNGGLYVAGAANGNLFVVGSDAVRALKLDDGKPAWKKPAALSALSGRGIIADDRLFVPAGSDGIVVLDLKTGGELGKSPLPGKRRPGNLIIVGGSMISQGVDSVDAFPVPRPGEAKP